MEKHDTTQTPPTDLGFREATPEEVEYVRQQVERHIPTLMRPDSLNNSLFREKFAVISDFADIPEKLESVGGYPDESKTSILVPPGVYQVPEKFFDDDFDLAVIGLPRKRNDHPALMPESEIPTLMLEGKTMEFIRETGEEVSLQIQVVTEGMFKKGKKIFFGVRLDASRPTLLVVNQDLINDGGAGDRSVFSNPIAGCSYGENIDLVDCRAGTFYFWRLQEGWSISDMERFLESISDFMQENF
jgi:hypothetical protein